MFNSDTIEKARERRNEIIKDYEDIASQAMEILDSGFEDSMTVMILPEKYRKTLRTTNIIERENGALRKRENVIQIFPNTKSAIRLMGSVLFDHNKDWLISSRYFNMQEYIDKRDKIKFKLKAA